MSRHEYPEFPFVSEVEAVQLLRFLRYLGTEEIVNALSCQCDGVLEMVERMKSEDPADFCFFHFGEAANLLDLMRGEHEQTIYGYRLGMLKNALAKYVAAHDAVSHREWNSVEYASGKVIEAYNEMRRQNDVGHYEKVYTKGMEEFFAAILDLARNAARLEKEVEELKAQQPSWLERPENIIPDDEKLQ